MTVPMAADRTNSSAFGGPQPHQSKPSSGFTPLPPIRRTSTIDLLSRTKLGADEDDRNPSPVGDSDNDVPPDPPAKEDMNYSNGNGHIPGQAQVSQAIAHPNQPQNFSQAPQQHPNHVNGQPQNPNGYAVGRGSPQPNGFPQQMFMGRGGPAGPHHQFQGQFQGQPGAPPMQNPSQPFNPQMVGNPIQKFPPNSQWKLEESHLSEPLIQHKPRPGANSPSQQQPSYYAAYDKETEDPLPSGRGQGTSGPRPRNNSNSIPPVSAERFRKHNIFVPHGHDQGQAGPPHQAGHPLFRGGPNNAANQAGRGSHDAGPSKEMDVHVDEVSVSSTASEERPKDGRRGSGLFSLTNRRNTGDQGSEQSASGKEKSSFFGGASNHNKFQPKQKSNLGSSFDHDDTSEHVSMKKRLSELTGMIKGVGNAKEGAKDDQPAKSSTAYPSRPSMQGPVRTQTGQMQPSPLGGPPLGIVRSSTGGMRPPETQQLQNVEEEREKKPMGGFLGGLFNKQGSKPPESKQQNQQAPPQPQRPPQQFVMQPSQFRPGQMPPPGQQFGPHPIFAGQQPPVQEGIPGQQGRQPAGPAQPTMTSPLSPQFLGTAQKVMMRRPSEITVSSQNQAVGTPISPSQRSQFGFQQGPPQVNIRPATAQDAENRNIGKQPGDDVFSGPSALSRDSPHRSRPSSPDVGGSQIATRITPNRKPVGSGFSRQDGASPTASPQTKKPAKSHDPSQPDSVEDEEVPSSQLPSGQQSPTLGKLGHVRQTSLPSPGRPLITSQPGQVNFQPIAGGNTPISPQGPTSPLRDQFQGHPNDGPQRPRGMSQPVQGPMGYISSPSGFSPQHNPGQIPPGWGPNYSFANQPRPGQPLHHHHPNGPRFVGTPALPPDQQKTINKFFGTDPRDKNIPTQPPKETKEKSAKEKFLGAFKRVSKQTGSESGGSPRPEKAQHQKPPPGHSTPPSMRSPQQSGQPMTQQQQQQPQTIMTRPQISGPSPAGPLGPMSKLPPQGTMQPGQGRGAPEYGPMNPPMMSGAGRGAPPPQGQAGRGQEPQAGNLKPQQVVQQRRRSAQNLEPQYDQVPIPRGYEAVHGYGNAGTIAPSPYNVGRPSPPPASHQQFQSFGPQGAQQQQQWINGQLQPGQPPSIKRNDGSESSTPTQSDQGTFLDMAPTPPPRPSQDEYRYDRQAPPPVPPQFLRQQAQPQNGPQQPPRPEVQTQTPSSSNWGSAPDSARSAALIAAGGGGILQSKPSDPNVSPPSDNDDIQRPAQQHHHQHIVTAMSNSPPHPSILQPGTPQSGPANAQRAFSPTSAPMQQHQHQQGSPSLSISQHGQVSTPLDPDTPATRLVSKMSATEPLRSQASLSPDMSAARAASVSPEPPGPPRAPFHQVSSTSLNVMSVNVERANEARGGVPDEDLYDATPRMGSAMGMYGGQGQGQQIGGGMEVGGGGGQDENIKYAGSERSRSTINGVASNASLATAAGIGAGAGVGLGVGLGVDAAGSQRGSDDSSFSEKQVSSNMDSEEKILVEQPVELAAVNDDDDGIPVMSATSYPGQEWNPYGAGEFGDWD